MGRDFLHRDAETPLCEHYIAAGAACSFSTNSEQLLEAARDSFLLVESPTRSVDFSVRLWVDNTDAAQPPWPKPYVRGLDHTVFASFDAGSSMLADLRTRHVIGRFSAGMAADSAHWRTVIFPMLLTIVSASVGVAELHCACVAKNQDGLLLAGPSGAGKSTLALALSQIGYGFLSDDRTFCSLADDGLRAWGLPTQLKLRPEATAWFRELRDRQLAHGGNGDSAFWLNPEDLSGCKRARRCRPTALIFLQRQESPKFQLSPISSTEAHYRLNADVMAELPESAAKRAATVEKLAELPCWLLEYGGTPQETAQKISRHFAKS